MQPVNWDPSARTTLTETLSLYVLPDLLRPPTAESFGDHLHRTSPAPIPETPREREPLRRDPPAEHQVATRGTTSEPQPAAESSPSQPANQDRQHSAASSSNPSSPTRDASPGTKPVSDKSEPDNQPSAGVADHGPAEADRETQAPGKRLNAVTGKSKLAAKRKLDGRHLPASGASEAHAPSATEPTGGAKLIELTPEEVSAQQPIPVGTKEKSTAETQIDVHPGALLAQPLNAEALVGDAAVPSEEDASENSGQGAKRGRRELVGERVIERAESPINALASGPAGPVPSATTQPHESSSQPSPAVARILVEIGKTPVTATSAPEGPVPTGSPLRFAQHLAAKPGATPARPARLGDLEHARMLDRVARAFQLAESRGSPVTLRLHPPELGALRVELRVVDGNLSARLEAESLTARTALLENVQLLHDRLAEQGIRIERFEVLHLDRHPFGDSSSFRHQRPPEQNGSQQPAADSPREESREPESTLPDPRSHASGNLNVII